MSSDEAFGLILGGKGVEDLVQSWVTLLLWKKKTKGKKEGERKGERMEGGRMEGGRKGGKRGKGRKEGARGKREGKKKVVRVKVVQVGRASIFSPSKVKRPYLGMSVPEISEHDKDQR